MSRLISWRHCFLGLVAGEVLLFLLVNVSLFLTNLWFGSATTGNVAVDGGIVGVATLISVIVGGYLAARFNGSADPYPAVLQGIIVAIGFIIVGAIYQFVVEAQLVHLAIVSGAKAPPNPGLDLGDVMGNDFLALFGGTVGGRLGRRSPGLMEPREGRRTLPAGRQREG
jgi:hypothetical protein